MFSVERSDNFILYQKLNKMKKSILLVIVFISQFAAIYSQPDTVVSLTKKTYMVPMRDGVKLFTLVLYPTNFNKPVPILIERTPYGADFPLKEDSALNISKLPGY